MASFNVSKNWGSYLIIKGERVESNNSYVPPVFPITRSNGKRSVERPMRVFAPDGIQGKRAKEWFNKLFRRDHKWQASDCQCCPAISVPNFPYVEPLT